MQEVPPVLPWWNLHRKSMINNNEPNIKLTPEQIQTIEETKLRLLNLETDISINTKNLKGIKSETERATKEIVYQTELLETITAQVNEKQVALSKINEELAEKSTEVNKMLNDFMNEKVAHEKRVMELKDREDKVTAEELKLAEHEKVVSKLTAEREQEEDIFNEKVAKLKEVIKDF